jgi:hypothetical protein
MPGGGFFTAPVLRTPRIWRTGFPAVTEALLFPSVPKKSQEFCKNSI